MLSDVLRVRHLSSKMFFPDSLALDDCKSLLGNQYLDTSTEAKAWNLDEEHPAGNVGVSTGLMPMADEGMKRRIPFQAYLVGRSCDFLCWWPGTT